MYNVIYTPSGEMIQEGTAVVLAENPSSRWIVHHGWYEYEQVAMSFGWYLTQVSTSAITPLTQEILATLIVLCNGYPPKCHCYPTPVTPGPAVPDPTFVGATVHTIDSVVATNADVVQIFESPQLVPELITVGDIVIGTNGCIAVITNVAESEEFSEPAVLTAISTGTMLARSDTCQSQQ